MKQVFLFIFFCCAFSGFSQNAQLADQYYSQGDFEKASEEYKLLFAKFPYNKTYLYRLVETYQKSGKYSKVDSLLNSKKERKNPVSQIWLAQNYILQKDSIKAQKIFKKGIKESLKSSYFVFQVGRTLQSLYHLNKALQLYKEAKKRFPNAFFELEEAKIYAEQNKPEKMTEAYLDFLSRNPKNLSRVRYLLTPYLSSEEGNPNLEIIKQTIIKHIKEDPSPASYRLLEWFYIQEKNYLKAFLQLRSLYAKKEAEIEEIYYLGIKSFNNKKYSTAHKILTYVKNHADLKQLLEKSKLYLLKIKMKQNPVDTASLETLFQTYLNEEWEALNRINLQMLFSDFLAFHKNDLDKSVEVLNSLLGENLPPSLEAKIKIKKADLFLRQALFNKALILYTQVQLDFPNNEIGHLATYKIALASFFKGDIDWAHNQLKVIKSVHSDLISNDAIDLDMLIINNKEKTDSVQKGLKELVHIKYLIFKNNTLQALEELEHMKHDYKGQNIYDDVLWEEAKLFEQQGAFNKALSNYKEIITLPDEIVYKDHALYRMAKIYEEELNDLEKAKRLYKKIIVEFPGSFWFTDARKAFRRLRGDEL